MLTISKPLSTGQAKDYYTSEYTNSNENYYSEDDQVKGEWTGRLADEWGLKGEVTREAYENLVEGKDPFTGEQLIKHVSGKERFNQFGDIVKPKEHRAGYDATFSAPKSVSLALLVGGDKRVDGAHRKAVDVALVEFEKYVEARMGGKNDPVTTGKFIAAKFEHDSARPDKETGYAAPQRHTHVVIFNMTQTEDGKVRSLDPKELYRSQRFATAIYRVVLAEELQKLGYEIEINNRTGAPEIKGFSREFLEANSPRRQEVLKEAEAIKQRLAEQGIAVKEGAGLNQAAAKLERGSKKFNREEMKVRHTELEESYGNQSTKVAFEARGRGNVFANEKEVERNAKASVSFARENATEREAVVDRRDVAVDALRRRLGFTTYTAVMNDLNNRMETGEFIPLTREGRAKEVTTQKMINWEGRNIEIMQKGQGIMSPTIAPEKVSSLVDMIQERQGLTLNKDQREALEKVLTTTDRISGLEGKAGTGKTTTLAVFREAAQREGYVVQGFASTTQAVKELAKSGIKTNTLQSAFKYLGLDRNEPDAPPKLYVVDESSLASTKQVNQLLKRIKETDRVLFVGDTIQHQAVEAGAPFEQLIKAGMRAPIIKEIVRQKGEIKEPVVKLSERNIKEGISMLEAQGRVIEIKDKEKTVAFTGGVNVKEKKDNLERLLAVAAMYRDDGSTQIIANTHAERVAINTLVHKNLKLDENDNRATILSYRQDMTGSERTFALAYSPGEDILKYRTTSKVYGIKTGDYGRVVDNDHEKNTITVELENRRRITYNPERLSGVEVYREQERNFAEGDRVQFRSILKEPYVENGTLGRIKQIEGTKYTVELDEKTDKGNKREVSFDIEKFPHIDHGYAITTVSSQGKTFNRIIFSVDTDDSNVVVNQRSGFVGPSRAVEEIFIFTNNKDRLGTVLDRQKDKEIALEAIQEANISMNGGAGNNGPANVNVGDEGNTKTHWMRVNGQDPCPTCGKPDNCAVSSDATTVYCRRVPSHEQGRDGGWIHRLDEPLDNFKQRAESLNVSEQNERASIDKRDAVYQAMLDELPLKTREKKNLKERGLDDSTIEKNEYRSTPNFVEAKQLVETLEKKGYDLKNIPGFYRESEDSGYKLNMGRWHQGLMVPVRNEEGKIEGFQIRRAEVGTYINEKGDEKKEPRYVWLSSAHTEKQERIDGASSGAPIHFRDVEKIKETGHAILTEGALKGDIAANFLDKGVIAVQGVSSFPPDFGKQLKELIPELQKVSIAFDADYAHNVQVQGALNRLNESLGRARLQTEQLKWDEQHGKGIDDYLKNKLSDSNETWQPKQGLEGLKNQSDPLTQAAMLLSGLKEKSVDGGVGGVSPVVGRQLKDIIFELTKVTTPVDSDALTNKLKETLKQAGIQTPETMLDQSGINARDTHVNGKSDAGASNVLDGKEQNARREEVLKEIGWTEYKPQQEQKIAAPDGNGNHLKEPEKIPFLDVKQASEVMAAKETLKAEEKGQELNRRLTLGDHFIAEINERYASKRVEALTEQAEYRRYEVFDALTGTKRELSISDVERRANNIAEKSVDDFARSYNGWLSQKERDEIKRDEYKHQLELSSETIKEIVAAHEKEVSKATDQLSKAFQELTKLDPKAETAKDHYKERGLELPVPIIKHDKLNELQSTALSQRDLETFKELETIRKAMPAEFSGPARDSHETARLRTHLISAGTDEGFAHKKLHDFRQEKVIYKVEIGNDEEGRKKLSLSDVAKAMRLEEKTIAESKEAIKEYKEQVIASIINPLEWSKLKEKRELVTVAEEKLAESKEKLTGLGKIQNQVFKTLEVQEQKLIVDWLQAKEIKEVLSKVVSNEKSSLEKQGKELPAPAFNNKEWKQLVETASTLKDASLLKETYKAVSEAIPPVIKDSDELQDKIEKNKSKEVAEKREILSRALAQSIVAKVDAFSQAEKVDQFTERGKYFSLLYTGIDGKEKVGRLYDYEPRTLTDKIKLHASTEKKVELDRLQQSFTKQEKRMVQEAYEADKFSRAAGENLVTLQQRFNVLDKEMPAPSFTAKEINRIEQAAAKTNNGELRAWYQSLLTTTSTAPKETGTKIVEIKKDLDADVAKNVAITTKVEMSQSEPVKEQTQKFAKKIDQGIGI